MKKTLSERIAILEAKKARAQARLVAAKGRQKVVDRRRDARRKILVGAAVLVEMEREPRFADYVRKILRKVITRPHDRDVLADLVTSAAEEVTAPAVSSKPSPAVPDPDVATPANRAAAAVQVTGHDHHPG